MALPHSADASLQRDWRKFTAAAFLFTFGFAVYSGVFQNFLRDVHHAQPLDLGWLESLREVPGLLTALTAGILVSLAESRVSALGLAITAIGIGFTGQMSTFTGVVLISVFWSIGFHLYSTMQGPITMNLAKGIDGGRHLGRISGVGAIATIAALALAYGIAHLPIARNYNIYFGLGGLSILAAAILLGSLGHHAAGIKRQRIVFRREYSLYYILIFLEGCRRQIFAIFASFTLIKVYGVDLDHMLALQLVNAVLIALTAPRMGKIIDKYGERRPLGVYAIGLVIIFVGYATVRNREVLMGLFILDNVLFTFNLGFTTYLNKIVRPGELTPCASMGVTMNHIAAVTVPVGGALLWNSLQNYQAPFWVGVGVAVLSLYFNQKIPLDPKPAVGPGSDPSPAPTL